MTSAPKSPRMFQIIRRRTADAKETAKTLYMEYRFKAKHDLPIVSKRFDAVARLTVTDMQKQLEVSTGRKVYRDYITATETYLIPFFGAKFVNNISHVELREYSVWRAARMGREPKASTITTHNSALNRVFEEEVNRGYMTKGKIPILVNDGDDGVRRPDFSLDDYRTMIRKLLKVVLTILRFCHEDFQVSNDSKIQTTQGRSLAS